MTSKDEGARSRLARLPWLGWVLLGVWTAVAVAVGWNGVQRQRDQFDQRALESARTQLDKNCSFRKWVVSHGGVYVPMTERTPPNPHLAHVEENEIITPSGKRLILMNAAYALRQMLEDYSQEYGTVGRITSLQPLNPDNAPNAWERSALEAIGRGAPEVREFVSINDVPHLRLMQPMVTEEGCLKCHGQYHDEGDILGGMTVTVPLTELSVQHSRQSNFFIVALVSLWLLGFVGIVFGVSAFQEKSARSQVTEMALQESEETYEALFNATNDAIFVFSPMTGRTLAANRSAIEMFGLSPQQAENLSVGQISENTGPYTQEEAERLMQRATAEGPQVFEWRARHASGEVFWVEVSLRCAEISAERRILAVMRNISRRKQAEAELERNREQLAELVEERTRELFAANISLQEAKRRAEAGSRAKSEFLANMSHELRTPLNAILGFTQLLARDSELSELQRNDLSMIEDSGEHLLALINDILEMSKIEAGRITLEETEFDLIQLIGNAVNMVTTKAQEKELDLCVEWDENMPRYLRTDQRKLQQILLNLLGNAVKFTDVGAVSMYFDFDPTESLLNVEVRDSGIGIQEKDIQRIFKPFAQTGDERRTKYEGSGLGLAISRRFVELMGGELSVESTPGEGSVFRFSIRASVAEEPTEPVELERTGDLVLAAGQQAPRVLVVEDSRSSRVLLTQILRSAGVPPREAHDGAEAIEVVGEWMPDLIWMDMNMPVMDGYDATRRIRDMAGGEKIKIIAITASAFEEDRQRVLECGCDDFVRKPYRDSEIIEMIQMHLGTEFVPRVKPPAAPAR